MQTRGESLSGEQPQPFHPSEALPLAEMLAGYTRNAAYAEFMQKQLGTLETGKLADVIVLSQDLFKAPPEQLKNTWVLLTMVGDKVVCKTECKTPHEGCYVLTRRRFPSSRPGP